MRSRRRLIGFALLATVLKQLKRSRLVQGGAEMARLFAPFCMMGKRLGSGDT